MQHEFLDLRYHVVFTYHYPIVQGVHAVVRFMPSSARFVCTWSLVRTLNLDWANLFPNYSSFITAPIIPNKIPE